MVEVSVIIPHFRNAQAVADQLPRLQPALDKGATSFEVIVVDVGDGSELELFEDLVADGSNLKLIQVQGDRGISAAITAGLRHARGRTIVVMEAGTCYPAEEIPKLLGALNRADMVIGRRPLTGWRKLWHRISRVPRWLLLGLETHEPSSCFWAARAEALAGMELARGMYRYLSTFVSIRGFRVNEVYVQTQGPSRPLRDGWPNPGDLLCAWWLRKRWRQIQVRQVLASDSECDIFPLSNDSHLQVTIPASSLKQQSA